MLAAPAFQASEAGFAAANTVAAAAMRARASVIGSRVFILMEFEIRNVR
jgi:hypothetical protein